MADFATPNEGQTGMAGLPGAGYDGPVGQCGLSGLPRPRVFPYAETVKITVPAGDTSASASIRAEREYFFTDMSVSKGGSTPDVMFSLEACNQKYVINAHSAVWGPCCDDKPRLDLRLPDNKSLEISVQLTAPELNDVDVWVSLLGFQGEGCSSL